MPSLIGNPFPLHEDSVETNAEARASVIRSLAGMSRYNYEMAAGASVVTGESPCVPRNPQGKYGVDLSGPPFGSAIRHQICGVGGVKLNSNMYGEKSLCTVNSSDPYVLPMRFFNRAHAPGSAVPYSRGYVVLRAYCVTGSALNLTVAARKILGSDSAARISAFSISSSTVQVCQDDNMFFDLVPGVNSVELSFSSTSSNSVSIISCSINQIVKRSHA